MTYEHILIEAEDGVGIVTLNRPDKLNAMNRQLSSELHDAVKRMDADEAIGCIVITGAGERAFSAGGDIHEQREDDRRYTEEELDAHRPPRRGSYEIAASAKPTIGMINGLAYGGAAVLASSLDMRVGCEDSRFRFLAAAYGRINSTWTLPNQVGWPIAKELLFSARVVEAEEAYRIGLLNHLVPREQLRAKTMELARMIAGNNRASVIGIKALLLDQMGQNLEQQWLKERHYTTHVVTKLPRPRRPPHSVFRYRGAKAVDFRSIPGIAGVSAGLLKRYHLMDQPFCSTRVGCWRETAMTMAGSPAAISSDRRCNT
jgi:enoyl-CoA hydratase/carnithine racemase